MESNTDIELQLDKKAFSVVSLKDSDDDEFWRSCTPEERLRAIEINRRMVFGYGDNPPRFQRFFEVARRGER